MKDANEQSESSQDEQIARARARLVAMTPQQRSRLVLQGAERYPNGAQMHVCCSGGDPECEGCLLCELARDEAEPATPSHPCVYRQEVA